MGHKQVGQATEPVAMTLEEFADGMMHKFQAQFAGMRGRDVADILARAAAKGEREGHIILTNKPGRK